MLINNILGSVLLLKLFDYNYKMVMIFTYYIITMHLHIIRYTKIHYLKIEYVENISI